MTISFKNDNDVIVYALEKVISYARRTQQIFVAQCVWWLASIIGLEQELIVHINNLQQREELLERPLRDFSGKVNPDRVHQIPPEKAVLEDQIIRESSGPRQDKVLKECEEFLQESRRLRDLATLKPTGKTRSGRINPLASTKQLLKVKKPQDKKKPAKTEGIKDTEIQRRKIEGQCLHCAWPSDRKRAHKVKDCVRKIKVDPETALIRKPKQIASCLQGSDSSSGNS